MEKQTQQAQLQPEESRPDAKKPRFVQTFRVKKVQWVNGVFEILCIERTKPDIQVNLTVRGYIHDLYMSCLATDSETTDMETQIKSLSPDICRVDRVSLHDEFFWKIGVTTSKIGHLMDILLSSCGTCRYFENIEINAASLRASYNIGQFFHLRVHANTHKYKLDDKGEKRRYIKCQIDDVIPTTTREELQLFGRISNETKSKTKSKKNTNRSSRTSVNSYKNPASQTSIIRFFK